MVSITLSVSEDLKREMEKFPEINWSAVARKSIEDKVEFLERMNRLTEKSRLTEEETILLGREVKKAVAKRYREMK